MSYSVGKPGLQYKIPVTLRHSIHCLKAVDYRLYIEAHLLKMPDHDLAVDVTAKRLSDRGYDILRKTYLSSATNIQIFSRSMVSVTVLTVSGRATKLVDAKALSSDRIKVAVVPCPCTDASDMEPFIRSTSYSPYLEKAFKQTEQKNSLSSICTSLANGSVKRKGQDFALHTESGSAKAPRR